MYTGSEKVKVNKATKDGASPLYIASAHGHSDAVRALLTSEELKVDKATKAGVTPLYICSQEGHADVARALLASQKADASKAIEAGFTPLMIAVHNGHEVNVQDLLAAGANPSRAANHGQSVLEMARAQGHSQVAKLVLDYMQARPKEELLQGVWQAVKPDRVRPAE